MSNAFSDPVSSELEHLHSHSRMRETSPIVSVAKTNAEVSLCPHVAAETNSYSGQCCTHQTKPDAVGSCPCFCVEVGDMKVEPGMALVLLVLSSGTKVL